MRNPVRDQVAIVGVGTTEYSRNSGKTRGGLVVEACRNALVDAGLRAEDVDGLCGSAFQASPQYVQQGLGLPAIRWWSTPPFPFSLVLTDAVNAVFSGACDVAVAYHSQFRTAATSGSAGATDPVRAVPDPGRTRDSHAHRQYFEPQRGLQGSYAGYMRRYMHTYGVSREAFGLVAINSRAHATRNPHACLRQPLSMEDYLAGRMVRDPMSLMDMDYAIDGGDALVVTTAERAQDMSDRYVLIDAMTYGQRESAEEDRYTSLDDIGQTIAADVLWRKTDLRLPDFDLFYLYDGFTVITLKWLESLGFCGVGEAGAFLADNWDSVRGEARLLGDAPLNANGGNLSEGAMQGSGHFRDAVVQLRGSAGDRQVPGARAAILAIGGLFTNSTIVTLRASS